MNRDLVISALDAQRDTVGQRFVGCKSRAGMAVCFAELVDTETEKDGRENDREGY